MPLNPPPLLLRRSSSSRLPATKEPVPVRTAWTALAGCADAEAHIVSPAALRRSVTRRMSHRRWWLITERGTAGRRGIYLWTVLSGPFHDLRVDFILRAGPAIVNSPSAAEAIFFNEGLVRFVEIDSVSGNAAGEPGLGLGPRFNLNSCAGCHAQPAVGGTSPFTNPQVGVANLDGAANTVPFFITPNGPVREARFIFNPDGSRDGGVHDLFTITGRYDAAGCTLSQPDFNAAAIRQAQDTFAEGGHVVLSFYQVCLFVPFLARPQIFFTSKNGEDRGTASA